ncbi:MAG: crossover junction endodeoxyribonuclease RuvC [Calditrichaeota bacterium]|nr:crossover junction endodeoxyribonuclease RuvC [Calditrichota bacterium]
MRVLGVDPGTLALGFGIVDGNRNESTALEYGCLKLTAKEAFPDRLKKIYDAITRIVTEFHPDVLAIENLFYAKNPKVAIKMGHARGVAIVAAINNQVPTADYSPREIKQSIAGNGAASKEQVQRMVQQLLRLQELPEPLDASDALAVALCHLHRAKASV